MKKTYLIVSDTHGDTTPLVRLAGEIKPLDGILHLGDHTEDIDDVRAVYPLLRVETVRGNNDWGNEPLRRVLHMGGRKIFMTHGHSYRVKMTLKLLIDEARAEGADAVLFGHTHVPYLEREGGLWVVNPGALRGVDPKFALMEMDEQGIEIKLYQYNEFMGQ